MGPFSFVIEHMEEDEVNQKSSLPRWVLLEYSQMLLLAGEGNSVVFTHLSTSSCAALDQALSATEGNPSKIQASQAQDIRAEHKSHNISILDLMKEHNKPLERVCLLDPKASKPLTPSDGEGEFDWFLFGGILGDDPPRDRTGELRALGFPTRHLGPVQMTTDTALGVTKKVIVDKIPLDSIPYVVCSLIVTASEVLLRTPSKDFPTIHFSKHESVEMPFRYISERGEPILPNGMKQHLYEDLNRGFDD